MGANLVPVVRGFSIQTKTFGANDCTVVEGCGVVGKRKLLRFDFLCCNAGNADVHMGVPAQNPQWYEFSPCHGHYHLKSFNEYALFDCRGRRRTHRWPLSSATRIQISTTSDFDLPEERSHDLCDSRSSR